MPNRKPDQVTLHEAILDVLRRAGRPLSAREVSVEIKRRGLYVRNDGDFPPASQISTRARKYPNLFKAEGRPLQFSPTLGDDDGDDEGANSTAAFQRLKRDTLEIGRYFLNMSKTIGGFDRLMEIILSSKVTVGEWSPEELARELEEVRLVDSAHEYDRLRSELILCRAVDGFLKYIADLMALVFVSRPETMKSAETVRLDFILENETMDDLIGALADKRVNDLAYKGMRELSSYLSDRLGLRLFDSPGDLERAAEIIEIRNLIVHNRGIINRTFLQKVSKPVGNLGELVTIEEDPMFDDLWILLESASRIDAAAVQKFGLPRRKLDS